MQPEDAPPPRPRVLPRRGRRGSVGRLRLIIFGVIAVGIFLLMSLRGLAGFYTDFCGSTRLAKATSSKQS